MGYIVSNGVPWVDILEDRRNGIRGLKAARRVELDLYATRFFQTII